MRAPDFWAADGFAARLLVPASACYALAGALRWRLVRPWRPPARVVCVGNAVAGGAGKTPVAIAIARRLVARGIAASIVAGGYRGALRGPRRVDPARHDARAVGDEALLLARAAPTWVARDRRSGVAAAIDAGAAVVILDDGLQDPAVVKDLTLMVVDGGQGFGNGRVIPAGPLREPLARAFGRADAFVVVGPDETESTARVATTGKPVLGARLEPTIELLDLADRPVLAFAGIGWPEKFFAMLRRYGLQVAGAHRFADHQRYDEDTVMRLVEEAARLGARPVTTEKDFVRLPDDARLLVTAIPVALVWADEGVLDRVLATVAPE